LSRSTQKFCNISGFSTLQGSVATYCRWGRTLRDVYNFFTNHLVKEFWKSVCICLSCYQTSNSLLFWKTVYIDSSPTFIWLWKMRKWRKNWIPQPENFWAFCVDLRESWLNILKTGIDNNDVMHLDVFFVLLYRVGQIKRGQCSFFRHSKAHFGDIW